MPDKSSLQFPSQKLSKSKKTKKWAENCIKAAEDLAIFRYSGIRESYRNKLINYNLANDVLDISDIETVCNPMGIKNATFPAKMQNYPIANPKIDLLVGEERKRKFDWKVRVINDDAISEKEKVKKHQLFELMTQKITATAFDKQEVEKELQKLQKYHVYEYQDLKERTASQILEYLYKVNHLKEEFARGFEDALIGYIERAGLPTIACYDKIECIEILSNDMDYKDAEEYFYFNVLGSYVGEYTPCFLTKL